MPTPHAILAESKRNWRRAAFDFGVLLFIVFSLIGLPARAGPFPARCRHSLICALETRQPMANQASQIYAYQQMILLAQIKGWALGPTNLTAD